MREAAIYRSRQPVIVKGEAGFIDFWTGSAGRAHEEAAGAPDRFVERLTWADVCALPPAAQLKARAAWCAAFPEDTELAQELPGVSAEDALAWLQTRYG